MGKYRPSSCSARWHFSTFFDAFAYAPGTLLGDGSWTTGLETADSLTVNGAGDIQPTGFNEADNSAPIPMDPASAWNATITFTFLAAGAPATPQRIRTYLQAATLCGAEISVTTGEYGLGQCTITLLKAGGDIHLGAVALAAGVHTLAYAWDGTSLLVSLDATPWITASTSLGSGAVDLEVDIVAGADPTNFSINAVEVDYRQ